MPSETISREGVTYRAARCRHCRGLVWPKKALRVHELMHTVKEMRFKLTKEQNRRAFTTMRSNW